jgi:hypothetical protein
MNGQDCIQSDRSSAARCRPLSVTRHRRSGSQWRRPIPFTLVLVILLPFHTSALVPAVPFTGSPMPLSASIRSNRNPVGLSSTGVSQVWTAGQRRSKTAAFLSSQQPPNAREAAGSTRNSDDTKNDANDDDSTEWKAVVAAFQMYKAAYGDLKVPQRFVVPNMPPWPRVSWGLKLGKVVSAIRSTGRYISDTKTRTARSQVLDQLGFVWSVRRSAADAQSEDQGIRLEQIITGVQVYQRIVGSVVDIPDNFVVPESEEWPESIRGLPLGRQMVAIKRSTNTALRDKFAALGIPLVKTDLDTETNDVQEAQRSSAPDMDETLLDDSSDSSSLNDVRFQNIYTALTIYKKLYNDLLVPQPFVVPKDPKWPRDVWGVRLGARVNAIRSQGTFVNNSEKRRKLLTDLGFVWNPPKEGRRGRKPKDELETTFEDSADDEAEDDEDDDALADFDGSFDFGMDFDMPPDSEKRQPSWNLDDAILPKAAAVEANAAAKEDEYVPERTLADSMEYATAMALENGIIEGLTPKKRVIKGKREKEIPWFNDDFGEDFVFEDVVEALTVYKSVYGDFSNLTNSDFVVPAPKEVIGFLDDDSIEIFDTGASARAAAAIARFEQQGQTQRSDDVIAAEIMRLQREVDQPYKEAQKSSDVADAVDAKWPEHLAGMTLGSIVTRMREGSLEVKHIPERKALLDAIEFDWGDPKYFIDVPFEKAMCAMYAYYLVRGDMFVPEDFIMPDEDPWPQALAGYEIGKAVHRLRQLQNFLEAYHIEKVGLLRMIDFVWFADTIALPLDPNELEMTPEMLLLGAMGHPDYAKMIDIPMGLPDSIVADGPFYETDDDPKLWWRKWHNWEYVKDYWYQQGRRDNAYVLRAMGYPRMADEHEEKYGPGLLSQISQVLTDLENGVAKLETPEERTDILEQLNYFRREMLGCTDIHPNDRDTLLSDLDTQMLTIMKDTNMDMAMADDLDATAFRHEELNGTKEKSGIAIDTNDDERDEEADDDDEVLEEQEFDVENELGLGGEKW